MTTSGAGAPLALEEDLALEVPEEPEKEEDDQDMPKDSESDTSSGSLLNFLTGKLIFRDSPNRIETKHQIFFSLQSNIAFISFILFVQFNLGN